MLRIGLLGCDATIAGVARAAVRRGDRLVAGHGVHAAALAGLAPPPVNSWEAMLDADTCDAVLVGADGWDDGRREAVKTLVQAGRPLVLSQPLELSMLWAYELDMIRRDTGGVLIPCLAARQHPFVARLRTAVEAVTARTALELKSHDTMPDDVHIDTTRRGSGWMRDAVRSATSPEENCRRARAMSS